MENINNFCKTKNVKILDLIENKYLKIIIDLCYKVLYLKIGDISFAIEILIYLGHLKLVNDYLVYNNKYDNNNLFDNFIQSGVAVIPVLNIKDLKQYRKDFDKTLENFPEYNRNNIDILYVLGGFAALGNPSSFHNPLVRELRIKAYNALLDTIFKPLVNYSDNKYNVEVLFDRMMLRKKGKSPTAEIWHRDIVEKLIRGDNGDCFSKIDKNFSILDDDEIYGGWLNLDLQPQYFSCILGSHLGMKLSKLKGGFNTVKGDDNIKIANNNKTLIEIPPGHLIIFPQYILHEVVAKKATYDMYRLFTGWRLTTDTEPLFDDTFKLMKKQGSMRVPGGMLPPMYSKNHMSFFKKQTIKWSQDTMHPNTLNKVDKDGTISVKRCMDSLEEYNLPKYHKYRSDELKYYKPHKI